MLKRSAIFAAIFGMLASSAFATEMVNTGLELESGPDPYASAVSRTVQSIAEFSRWPDETKPLKLCIVGPADHADQITSYNLSRGRSMRTLRFAARSLPDEQCDLVYIGRLALAEQRQLTADLLGKPVLTIAENDPACRSRAMFCLVFQLDSLGFRANIDAISRSQVQVDARVLRLATTAAGRP